jgi:hypothetical protein
MEGERVHRFHASAQRLTRLHSTLSLGVAIVLAVVGPAKPCEAVLYRSHYIRRSALRVVAIMPKDQSRSTVSSAKLTGKLLKSVKSSPGTHVSQLSWRRFTL